MSEKNPMSDAVQRLRRDLDALDAALASQDSGCAEEETPQKREESIDELFSYRVNVFRDHDKGTGASAESGWEYPILKRRKSAILHLMEEAQRRFGEKYPALSVPGQLMQFSAPLANSSFDALNQAYDIELAAAIWMLDALKANDAYEEARQYFPQSREELDEVDLPNLTDSVHSDDELKAMICIIHHRNRGMSGYRDDVAFGDEADAELRKDGDSDALPDRMKFDAVLTLIDPETIRAAQEEWTAQLWDHFDQLLSVVNARTLDLRQKQHVLRNTIAAQIADLEQTPAMLSVNSRQDALQDFFTAAPSMTAKLPEIERLARETDRLTDELSGDEDALGSVYYLMNTLPECAAGNAADDGQTVVYADLHLPVIRDPYDSCFAFLSLLDANSDLIWLYNLSLNITAFACIALPWADSEAMAPDDRGELGIDYEYLRSLIEKKPDWDEDVAADQLYRMCIPSPLLKSRRSSTSIAGLTCLLSGLIPPRSSGSISFTRALLNETDYPPQMQELLCHYFAFAYSISHREDDDTQQDERQIGEELPDDRAQAEDRDAEIKMLRSRIKHLKNVVNRTEHQNKSLTAELGGIRHQLDAANAELAELRSMIRETRDEDGASQTVVDFPYTVTQRTVIIGGHDSWIKAIRPLLNNVRYIGPSEQPNPGVILNSEVVWIQTNAMGHSNFYKIIDIIRKNDIKVCYFKYASAEKCAEQLALEDASLSGR